MIESQFTVDQRGRHRVTGFITEEQFKELFLMLLPQRGAQSFIISNFLTAFLAELKKRSAEDTSITPHDHAVEMLHHIKYTKLPLDELV